MSLLKRFIFKMPCVRWCLMQFRLNQRRRQVEATNAYVQSVLTTLGNITIGWAGIELMLAHLVIWHHVKRGIVPEKGLPRMLTYQLKYLKDIVEKDETIPLEIRNKIRDIRTRVSTLNEFRISVTHGVLHQRNSRTTDWYTHSIKIEGLTWKVVRHAYTNEDVQAKSKEISDLGHEMSPFIASIVGIEHPQVQGQKTNAALA